jgi:large subunit ribosomal protein L6
MVIAAELKDEIKLPKGVNVEITKDMIKFKGPKGEVKRNFSHPRLKIGKGKESVIVSVKLPDKKEKALFGTWCAHIRNMAKGVTDGFEYRMKIVYAHLPIKASVKGDLLMIENFLGERTPRSAKILGSSKVKVEGNEVIITGPDIEEVSQTAANIEQATMIADRDPRVFQDGIYITVKG